MPAVKGWPLIYIFTIVTAVFAFFDFTKHRKIYLYAPPNVLLVAFFCCILISHLSHTYLQGAIDSFNLFVPNVIMFFLFVSILVSEKKIKVAIWFLIISTFILAVEGIQQHYAGIGWAGQTPYFDVERGETRIRWIGIFEDPNDLALVFVVGAGFLMSFLVMSRNLFFNIVCIGMLAVLGQALYYTNSRGGFLAIAATVVFLFLKRIKNKVFALSIGCFLAFIVILVGPSRMSQMNVSEASAYGRIDAWYEGFEMLKMAPLFGVGHRLFTDYHSIVAHNSYISVAAEVGIIGFFAWIALIYVCFKGLVFVEKKNHSAKPYIVGLEAGLVGFLSASYFLSRSDIIILYLLLALAASFMYTNLKEEEYALDKNDWKRSVFLSISILTLVWISMHFSI